MPKQTDKSNSAMTWEPSTASTSSRSCVQTLTTHARPVRPQEIQSSPCRKGHAPRPTRPSLLPGLRTLATSRPTNVRHMAFLKGRSPRRRSGSTAPRCHRRSSSQSCRSTARCWRPCPPTREVVGLIRFARSMSVQAGSQRALIPLSAPDTRLCRRSHLEAGQHALRRVPRRSREISGGSHDDHREQGLRRGRDAGRHRIPGRVRSCDNASCGAPAVRAATSRPRSGGSVLYAPRRGHDQGRARAKWPRGAPVPLTRPEA